MDATHEGLFGRIALHLKLISASQLRTAVEVHGRPGNKMRMGDILVHLGWLSAAEVEKVLVFQKKWEAQLETKAQAAPTASAAPGGPVDTPSFGVAYREVELENAAEPSTSSRKMDQLLLAAARYGASDLHVHVGHPVLMRLQGQLRPGKSEPYTPATAEEQLLEILTPRQREDFLAHGDLAFAYEIPGVLRARAAYCRQERGGADGVFRLIPLSVPALESLGIPRDIARFTTYHQGLVLFTGPAGCGKSTTMAALLNNINTERKEHIITVEDPIEFIHPSKGCLVRQRQVVDHTDSFDRALRAALREDPDIIVVGELRDRETIGLAISAAETGHLVYGTLHTNNAVRTINRILDVFPPEQVPQIRSMVSESLRGVVSQRLVAMADGKRRVPALEILTANLAVSNLIREGKTFQIPGLMQVGRTSGMCLLDDSLADLVARGVIAKEEAVRHAENPGRFA
jgi:twitching motility protein PilT